MSSARAQLPVVNPWDCHEGSHKCGGMPDLKHRCKVYLDTWRRIKTQTMPHPEWWRVTEQRNTPADRAYARPRNCIHNAKLLSENTISHYSFSYIAVSYVWAQNRSWKIWEGREVTAQALAIAARLSKHTSLPLWIDAICIPQNDEESEVKMAELAKMADIYRGAAAVICLIPEMLAGTREIVAQATALIDGSTYRELENAGDIYGSYMFATRGENKCLLNLFGSRWWERAWTFQEAVLNKETYLVGPNEETISIGDVWKISSPIRRRSSTMQNTQTMGRPANFWHSIATMETASTRAIPLGDAMACVWRRHAEEKHDKIYSMLGVCQLERIKPNYKLPFNEVLISLIKHANDDNDYSWLKWCHTIDPDTTVEGMCMVPTPDNICLIPFTSNVSSWESIELSRLPTPRPGGGKGVLLPHQSTGVVSFKSPPLSLPEIVQILKQGGHDSSEIWDMIFGMQVGLAADIESTVGVGTSELFLNCALRMIDGYLQVTASHLDMPGTFPFTKGIGFMNYSAMAAQTWKNSRLVIVESQGGTAVMPEHRGTGKSRIHKLPILCKKGVCLALLVYDATMFHGSATGILIEKKHAGNGRWQVTRFGGSK